VSVLVEKVESEYPQEVVVH
jgi:hypothetical protein